MDTLDGYRKMVRSVLDEYVSIPHAQGNRDNIVVTDSSGDHYLWLSLGWDGPKRIHYVVVHIDIINDKIWIQRDQTEDGVALDLERAGVPKDRIVLGFHSPAVRPYTDYAPG